MTAPARDIASPCMPYAVRHWDEVQAGQFWGWCNWTKQADGHSPLLIVSLGNCIQWGPSKLTFNSGAQTVRKRKLYRVADVGTGDAWHGHNDSGVGCVMKKIGGGYLRVIKGNAHVEPGAIYYYRSVKLVEVEP